MTVMTIRLLNLLNLLLLLWVAAVAGQRPAARMPTQTLYRMAKMPKPSFSPDGFLLPTVSHSSTIHAHTRYPKPLESAVRTPAHFLITPEEAARLPKSRKESVWRRVLAPLQRNKNGFRDEPRSLKRTLMFWKKRPNVISFRIRDGALIRARNKNAAMESATAAAVALNLVALYALKHSRWFDYSNPKPPNTEEHRAEELIGTSDVFDSPDVFDAVLDANHGESTSSLLQRLDNEARLFVSHNSASRYRLRYLLRSLRSDLSMHL